MAAGSSQTRGGPEFEGQCLEAGVDDRAVVGRAAHHRRPHEEARLESLGRGAVTVEVAAVIGVHEDVGAALQFGVDAARQLELEGAGAGPGDGRALDAVSRQEVAGAACLVGGPGDRLAAFLPAAQMLRRAVIGLQSTKGEVRRLRDLPRERERRLARLDAAAVAAHVDLDIDRQRDPGLTSRLVERADLARIVGAHADAGDMCERGEAPQFLASDNLVGDEHVRDPALDHRLGLADLLNAHADRAERNLLQRDDRAFVGLGVRPRPDIRAGDAVGQAAQIALERVEIDDECGSVDLVEGHADLGGRAGGHGRAS